MSTLTAAVYTGRRFPFVTLDLPDLWHCALLAEQRTASEYGAVMEERIANLAIWRYLTHHNLRLWKGPNPADCRTPGALVHGDDPGDFDALTCAVVPIEKPPTDLLALPAPSMPDPDVLTVFVCRQRVHKQPRKAEHYAGPVHLVGWTDALHAFSAAVRSEQGFTYQAARLYPMQDLVSRCMDRQARQSAPLPARWTNPPTSTRTPLESRLSAPRALSGMEPHQ